MFRFAEPDLGRAAGGPGAGGRVALHLPRRSAERRGDAGGLGRITDHRDETARQGRATASDVPRRTRRRGTVLRLREFRPPQAQRPLRTLFTGNVVTDLAAPPAGCCC